MSKTKSPPPLGAAGASTDPTTVRTNPEVDAKIDHYIKENPKYWAYVQGLPRERLERSVVLNEVRALERQQRVRDNTLKQISQNPELKQAYDKILQDLPPEQREKVMTELARQTKRAVSRVQEQTQVAGQSVSG